jgi:FkbM family methyltransferase
MQGAIHEDAQEAKIIGNTTIEFERGFNNLRFCRHGPMVYNRNDAYVGRSFDIYGEYNEDECEFLLELVKGHSFVVEVGANIGSHTIPLAQRCALVYAFEPQRLCYQALCANAALNQLTNVFSWQAAIGATEGRIFVPDTDPRQRANFGGISLQATPTQEAVVLLTLDGIGFPRVDLLKIDVEGMELDVLIGAEKLIDRHRPYIYIENDRRDKSAALITWLQEQQYELYWHLPPLFSSKNFAGVKENVFPSIVSVNMLCLPKSGMDSFGLRRVKGPQDHWH